VCVYVCACVSESVRVEAVCVCVCVRVCVCVCCGLCVFVDVAITGAAEVEAAHEKGMMIVCLHIEMCNIKT